MLEHLLNPAGNDDVALTPGAFFASDTSRAPSPAPQPTEPIASTSKVDPAAVAPAATAKGKGKAKAPPKKRAPAVKKPRAKSTRNKNAELLSIDSESDYDDWKPGSKKRLAMDDYEEDAAEVEDDRLYCLCETRYNPVRLMMACDGCDNWYHLECIKVSVDDVELINDFICPRCEPTTTKRTTWKPRCLRPTCNRAAARLSKYCSDWCGIEVAAQRLERTGLDPLRFWPAVAAASKLKSVVVKSGSVVPVKLEMGSGSNGMPPTPITPAVSAEARQATAADERAREQRRLRAELDQLAKRRTIVEASHELVLTRLRFFDHALKRAETLKIAHLEVHAPEMLNTDATGDNEPLANKKTSKPSGKGAAAKARSKKNQAEAARSRAIEGAPCGFDVRLAWDDRDWAVYVTSEEGLSILEQGLPDLPAPEPAAEDDEEPAPLEDPEGYICLLTRKRCDRHTGWDRQIEASFVAEQHGLDARLEQLSKVERARRRALEDSIESGAQAVKAQPSDAAPSTAPDAL